MVYVKDLPLHVRVCALSPEHTAPPPDGVGFVHFRYLVWVVLAPAAALQPISHASQLAHPPFTRNYTIDAIKEVIIDINSFGFNSSFYYL